MRIRRPLSRTAARHVARLVAAAALLVAAPALVSLTPADAAPSPVPAPSSGLRAACAPAHDQVSTCFARFRGARDTAARRAKAAPALTPADIASAYRLPTDLQPSTTVAIVIANDDPKVEKDLSVYRQRFGLPACTTDNGCFRKVNQKGKAAPLPRKDVGAGVEMSLDLDAVSAACPSCHLLLVEADELSDRPLGTAVNTAVRLGASVVSMSFGRQEFSGQEVLAASYYSHPGVALVAASGDDGFGVPSVPAILPGVIGVGGTSLSKATATDRGWTERAWFAAGSGCSGYVAKPAWQHDPHCPTRMSADVSAVADPDSGFLVYDSFGLGEDSGYIAVGGTSLSTPLIAGMIARAGHAASYDSAEPIYEHSDSFFDVVGGRNGFCGRDYLCTGKPGYDGPTGVGTPDGLGRL